MLHVPTWGQGAFVAPAQAAAKEKTRDNSVLCNIVTLKEWPSKVLIESCLRVNIKFYLRKLITLIF